ncbi:MAG: aminotransferase class V-fold PLP-dependent enzyme [Acidobacteria bacterium]|nr:aminotransferase class V-fold PLP-dependent enzyme [Acidobacteriota bacterium]TDI51238.1 MAG: aminotransferase class V-fold PLP-dependent enzyme [Acidobacteriota bacterium]TDI52760.1 MAG: aminotransferase class V-fold PLP-dependent enzyme [Acidobacteriota bacterium]
MNLRKEVLRVDLVEKIHDSVIGKDTAVETPFGLRRVTYADYTASGRSLSFIEDYIRAQVLPMYANTHTETSGTGLQTTRFREDARDIIKRCIGANNDEHAVIFAGNGATGAVDRLIGILGLRIPDSLEQEYHLGDAIPANRHPVVFVGPYEHHSNELPWRESIADVVEINEDADGQIDLTELEERLVEYAERPLKIGSFSAASNVTGIISDTSAISRLLHKHDALSFWDFAASAPYVGISMGSTKVDDGDYKDAIFISPHKLIGGPGSPGLLVARRDLLTNKVPAVPGGGTVQYVSPDHHTYITDQEHREEGGTPAIIGSIRAGLVFKLKDEVGPDRIRGLEHHFIRRAIDSWKTNPSIDILGNPDAERLSIVSFVIRTEDKVLHHNYVVALLNDLFGIQARGGCSCAGPYGHRLLGIDLETSRRFEDVIATGCEVLKPGWVRLNFNYFISESEFDYIVEAVHMIGSDGWRLLPLYTYEAESGIWRHRDGLPKPPKSLKDVDFDGAEPAPATVSLDALDDYIEEAKRILSEAPLLDGIGQPLPTEAEELRWFPTPTEVGK